jgi:hypothetical protein
MKFIITYGIINTPIVNQYILSTNSKKEALIIAKECALLSYDCYCRKLKLFSYTDAIKKALLFLPDYKIVSDLDDLANSIYYLEQNKHIYYWANEYISN